VAADRVERTRMDPGQDQEQVTGLGLETDYLGSDLHLLRMVGDYAFEVRSVAASPCLHERPEETEDAVALARVPPLQEERESGYRRVDEGPEQLGERVEPER